MCKRTYVLNIRLIIKIFFFQATEWERRHPQADLLSDLKMGFRLDRLNYTNNKATTSDSAYYADPMSTTRGKSLDTATTTKGWFSKWFG